MRENSPFTLLKVCEPMWLQNFVASADDAPDTRDAKAGGKLGVLFGESAKGDARADLE